MCSRRALRPLPLAAEHTFGEKVLSAMRFGFGGHVEGSESIDPETAIRETGHPSARKGRS